MNFSRSPLLRRALIWPLALGCALLALFVTTRGAHAQNTWHVDDGSPDRPVLYLKFDEGSGLLTRSYPDTAHTAALPAGAVFTSTLPAPLTTPNFAALQLDGSQVVTVTESVALNLSDNFTFSAWVRRRPADIGTSSVIYDAGTEPNTWYVGFLSDNRLTFTTDGLQDYPSSLTITDSNWHFVAFRKSGDTVTVFLDLSAQNITVGTVPKPTGFKLVGGKTTNTGARLNGAVDELRFFNRVLATAEIVRLAQGRGCAADGTTWGTAYFDLHCALDVDNTGDTIRVARGRYLPGTNPNAAYTINRSITVLGGFDGFGAVNPDNRPAFDAGAADAEATVLTGDLLGDDVPATLANFTENTINVLKVNGGPLSTTIDGLRVRGGNARAPSSTGGGMIVGGEVAGVTLNAVHFFANRAVGNGGGVFSAAALQVTNSRFSFNGSTTVLDSGSGGAIASSAPLVVQASQFLTNTQQGGNGGAIFATGTLSITGSLFQGNIARTLGLGEGGAIAARGDAAIIDSDFITNKAGGSGGAIRHSQAGALTVRFGDFTANQAQSGGAIATGRPASVEISTFRANVATSSGGAIDVGGADGSLQGGVLTFDSNRAIGLNCTIPPDGCSNGFGGAIRTSRPVTLAPVAFTDNFAVSDGGAIVSFDASINLSASTFTGNNAGVDADFATTGSGGAIAGTGALTIADSGLHSNQAEVVGGAIRFSGTMTITTSSITLNQAPNGGGVSATGSLLMANASFQRNSADAAGGGLLHSGAVDLTNVAFLTNTAANGDGGGFFLSSGSAVVRSGSLRDNSALGRGGGAALGAGTMLNMDGTLVEMNSAAGGGGMLATAAQVQLVNVTFRRNTGESDNGGGAEIDGGVFRMTGGGFVENRINDDDGGGIKFFGGAQGTLDRVQFLGNIANQEAGALSVEGGGSDVITVTNGIFAGNSVAAPIPESVSNVILVSDGTVRLINNTLAGNTGFAPNALLAASGGSLNLQNVLAWENKNLAVALDGGSISSAFTTVGPGGGSLDPLLVEAPNPGDGDWTTPGDNDYGDLHLQLLSPAIDAGSGALLPAGIAQDFDGQSRVFDVNFRPNASASPVDQGAFEARFTAPTAHAGGPYSTNEGAPLALDGSDSSDDGTIVAFEWDCTNDGSFEITAGAPTGSSCTYPDDGSFTLALRVADSLGLTSTVTSEVIVNNLPPVAGNDSASTAQETPVSIAVLANDSDVPADPLSIDAVADPANGSAAVAGNAVTYTPDEGFGGVDTFSYTVTDGDGGTDTAIVTVTVIADDFKQYLPAVQN